MLPNRTQAIRKGKNYEFLLGFHLSDIVEIVDEGAGGCLCWVLDRHVTDEEMNAVKEEKGKTESGRQSMGIVGAQKCSQFYQLILWLGN